MDLVTQERLIERELHAFQQHLGGLEDPRWPPDIRLVNQHICTHLFDPALSVEDLRRRFGLRGGGYAWHAKRWLRATLRRYIENLRMLAAMRLLLFGEVEVWSVALGVGYAHPPRSFRRAFRRCADCSPTAFREGTAQRGDALQRCAPGWVGRPVLFRLVPGASERLQQAA